MYLDRNGKPRVKWREDGKQRTKSFSSKTEAALFEAQIKAGVITAPTKEQEQTTFALWADKWFKIYAQVEKSESTWSNDEQIIKNHINPIIGNLRLSDIKKMHGQDLKSSVSAKGLKPKTVNNVLQLAKKILNVAVDYELISANPWRDVKRLKVPKRDFRYWTQSESDKFLKRCKELDPEFHDLVLFAIRTGLRLGEIQALARKDLDFENGLIRVGATWSIRLGKKLDRTKNGEIGFVPMTPQVRAVLLTKKMMKPNQQVFRPSMVQHARERLLAMCDKAMVQKLTFHDLRHTFASQLAMGGLDMYRIQKLMRHKHSEMTQRYAHLHPDSLRSSADFLDGTQLVHSDFKNVNSEMVRD